MRSWCPMLVALLASTSAALGADRPNLLLIVTDNESPSLLGAYGNREIRTPHIDQLAADGMLFTRAFATSGVCSPARATLLTGLIPSRTGVHNGLPERFTVPDYSAIEEFRNLPQTLADAGYVTALVGKYHLGAHEKPQLGFGFWATFSGGHTESFVAALSTSRNLRSTRRISGRAVRSISSGRRRPRSRSS
jgi:arylsulfatase A-like enzyme